MDQILSSSDTLISPAPINGLVLTNSSASIELTAKESEEHKAIDVANLMGPEMNQIVKIAVTGNVDSGKTTLVGVLTKGTPDDGRGSARARVFNYSHESETGRTASITQEIMGFDEAGKQVIPERFVQSKNKYWPEVVKKSKKVVTLFDLCGHKKYLKTTMFGLVGMVPDYVMIVVGANMGVSRTTREHLGVTLALKIPFFVVLTKVDMCPDNIYKETLESLMKILKSGGVNRKPMMVKTNQDVTFGAENLWSDRICPVFSCSSVNLDGIDKLTRFISLLTNRNKTNKLIRSVDSPVQFDIRRHFMVAGVGICISGTVRGGTIKMSSVLMLGPDKTNGFKPVVVKSIHVNRVPTEETYAGQIASLSIRPLNKKDTITLEDFRKGMVLVDQSLKTDPIWEFEAEILILHHATTIREGYQAVLHCGVISQSVTVEFIPAELLRTGDKGVVKFRFKYYPEYMRPGLNILLREGSTKILGIVTKIIDAEAKKNKEGAKTDITLSD